jgi:ubiquinone/menaquinone biosynthesis C-methylase UbiE
LRRLNPNGSPTFHDYGLTPPLNVLDLGCGHGGWVVEAATAWKSFGTKVTGLDLVDVSSHSWEVNEASLDNITWVQGDLCVD